MRLFILRRLQYLPLPKGTKLRVSGWLLRGAYDSALAQAIRSKQPEAEERVHLDFEWDLHMQEHEEAIHITRQLTSEARRLRVPLPPRPRLADPPGADVYWDSDENFPGQYLTSYGVAHLRANIRHERMARHDMRNRWLSWIGPLTGLVGAATGLLALLHWSLPK